MSFLSIWLFLFEFLLLSEGYESLEPGFFLDGFFAIGFVFGVVDGFDFERVLFDDLVAHVELLFLFDLVAFDCCFLGVGDLWVLLVWLFLREGFDFLRLLELILLMIAFCG